MRFKDLKLGQKLAIGFGVLILIAVALGTLAIVNMRNISTQSNYLAKEYIPEVEVANEIERNSLMTMYNMRGYAYTEEERFLNEGQSYLKKTNNNLVTAEKLAQDATQLNELKGAIVETQTAVSNYGTLVDETIALNKTLAETRANMDKAAVDFLQNCMTYLDNQNSSFEAEYAAGNGNLGERHKKITWINDIIDKGNTVRIENFKAQATRDPDNYQKAIDEFSISSDLSKLREITRETEDITALNNIENAASQYKQAMQNFLTAWKKREDVSDQRTTTADLVLVKSQEVSVAGITNTKDIAIGAVDLLNSSSVVMVVGLVIALLIGVLLAVFLTNLITAPIKKGVDFAKTIANGDLNAKIDVDQKDEIGILADALTQMVAKLKDIVTNIVSGADNIASASLQMSSTSQEMSQGANEQASSTEEVSSSMEEMSSNIQQNTDNARQTESISVKATEGVRKGNEASQKSVAAMKEIAQKITIINDIAFQTNILALNAAVEAARAGEHGKGFAVVAAEVRKLAERSAKAAGEIDMVSKEGVEISENAGRLLSEIVPEIEKTARLVQEIAAASIEQSSGADQVNSAIQQLNQVTQQNAAAAEEMATSSEELSSQADQLKDIVSYFKIDMSSLRTKSFEKKQKHLHQKIEHLKENSTVNKGIKIDLQDKDSNDNDYESF